MNRKTENYKMRQIVDDNLDANFLLESGNRIMIKRRLFEEYLDRATVICVSSIGIRLK